MNKEAQLQLKDKFYKETGMNWENNDGEPDIDYVEWLEAKVIAVQNDVSGNEALRVALPSELIIKEFEQLKIELERDIDTEAVYSNYERIEGLKMAIARINIEIIDIKARQ